MWMFARLDYQDREKRRAEKSLEFIWRPFYDHLGKSSQIFTSAFYDEYWVPGNLLPAMSPRNHANPVIIEEDYPLFNANQTAETFMAYLTKQAAATKTDNLFVPIGGDFQFNDGPWRYRSIDNLMKVFNAMYSNMTMMYSTPSKYLDAIIAANETWPTKYDDMLPYAQYKDDYWTGFYTSRPNFKSYIRRGQHHNLAANRAFSLMILN